MANDGTKNLIPQSMRTKEEQREIARKGGKASGAARRERKLMREALAEILSREYIEKDTGEKVDGTTLLMVKAFKNALNGDMRAIEFVRDTLGEKPTERVEINADIEKAKREVARLLESAEDEGSS